MPPIRILASQGQQASLVFSMAPSLGSVQDFRSLRRKSPPCWVFIFDGWSGMSDPRPKIARERALFTFGTT